MAVDAFTSPTRGLLTAVPTFESPAARARQLGYPLVEVPVDQRSLQIDLDGIAARARDAGLIFLCNPNNPTGALHSAKVMREFVATVRRTAPQAFIMLDEAYHDYVEDASYESLLPLALEDPQLFVTRTFSKAYGMAGIRLGYAVGKPETMKKLAEYRLGNSVNVLAFAAGRAAIAAASMIPAERARNTAALAFTARLFGEMGFTVVPSHANFVFADIRRDARAFQAACLERGVMVGRPFAPFTTWTRVSIGTMDEMQRAATVFRNILGSVAERRRAVIAGCRLAGYWLRATGYGRLRATLIPAGDPGRDGPIRSDVTRRSSLPGCYRANAMGGAARGTACLKSSPTSAAMVAAICDVVTVTLRRTPSAGTPGPIMAIHVRSAAGTSVP